MIAKTDGCGQLDPQELADFLRAFLLPNEVHELVCKDGGGGMAQLLVTTNSPSNLGELVAARAPEADHFYVGCNPTVYAAEHTTSGFQRGMRCKAPDIKRRGWLPIDCDPTNDGSPDDAAELADSVAEYLADLGWVNPLVMDSGRGRWLLYRVDLANDDNSKSLIRDVLKALAERFNTPGARIDTRVHDAARVVRLAGTVNAKTGNLARMVREPGSGLVTPEQLAELVTPEPAGQGGDALDRLAEVDAPLPGRQEVLEWAERHLTAIAKPAVQGEHGQTSLFGAACDVVHGFALDEETAFTLLRDCYNPRCVPPWNLDDPADLRDFRHQVTRACERDDHEKLRGHLAETYSRTAGVDLSGLLAGQGGGERINVKELDEWRTPEPLEDALPRFPTHCLPEPLRSWVEAEALATQTPPDMAALLGLSVVSACIARRVVVEPRDGWHEPVNLFTAAVLEPGSRKSAVFSDALRPLVEIERELIEAARPDIAERRSDRRRLELQLSAAEKAAAKHDDPDARDLARRLARELAELPEPYLPVLLIDQSTPEHCEIALHQQGGRIFSASPEGSALDLLAGRYAKNGGANFEVFLKGHAGDDLRVGRVGRDSFFVSRPALTAAYCIQPAVVSAWQENPEFRGRGLLARFLYAYPDSGIGYRSVSPPTMPDDVRRAYHQLVRGVSEYCEDASGSSEILRPTEEARRLIFEWAQEIETGLRDGGHLEPIRDWGSKLVGATIRLAAVIHAVENGPQELIQPPSVAAAVEIARSLIPHALRVLARGGESPALEDAQYLLRWIERGSLDCFTRRDAHQHGRRRWPTVEGVDRPLGVLVGRGFIRPKPTEPAGPGRPASPVFEVNPCVLRNAGICTHNTHN